MARSTIASLLVIAFIGCQVPKTGIPGAATVSDDTVDPDLLAEFEREVEANRDKAPSYGAATVAPQTPSSPQAAAVPFPFLVVTTVDVQTDGRTLKIRGRVTNPYDETVEGVHYIVSIGSPGEGGVARELDRIQVESWVTIEPRGSAPLRLDVSSMYLGTMDRAPFAVGAVAKKVGGREIPLPGE